MKGQPLAKRFGFAADGLLLALRLEASLRLQAIAGIAVLAALFALRPAPLWWALAALSVGLVWVAELINTALERLSDHLHPEVHPQIRAVKDIAAAAVLVASAVAICIALAFLADLLV